MDETQRDPAVMYLVVRRDRVTSVDRLFAAVFAAAYAAERTYGTHRDYAALTTAWREEGMRKVVLRAGERDWEKLIARISHVFGADPTTGEPLVAALPVRRRSEAGPFLSGLSAYTVQFGDLDEDVEEPPESDHALLATNPDARMGVGKAAAQVAHAATLLADAIADVRVPVRIVSATRAGFRAAPAEFECLVVADAGLTELERGTKTVLVTLPADPATNEERAAILGG